jgi:ATP phosphoribosyltransferase
VIRLGLPKGRMAAESGRICRALGITPRTGVLSYQARAGGQPVSVHLLKAPDVARMLRDGLLDLGLACDEWLMETGAPPSRRCLEARLYTASVCLLTGRADRRPLRCLRSVVTPYPNLARSVLGGIAPAARVIPVGGSTEALVPGIADACLDVVETGASAARNGLVIRRSLMHVTTHLARSAQCDPAAAEPVVSLLAEAMSVPR